jgi:hypothetical protein
VTIVLDLPPWAAERLKAEAAAKGTDEAGLLLSLLRQRYAEGPTDLDTLEEMTEDERRERARQIAEEARRTRPTEPPAWIADIQPANPPSDGTNGLHRIVGRWPGDETAEEIDALLEHLS